MTGTPAGAVAGAAAVADSRRQQRTGVGRDGWVWAGAGQADRGGLSWTGDGRWRDGGCVTHAPVSGSSWLCVVQWCRVHRCACGVREWLQAQAPGACWSGACMLGQSAITERERMGDSVAFEMVGCTGWLDSDERHMSVSGKVPVASSDLLCDGLTGLPGSCWRGLQANCRYA